MIYQDGISFVEDADSVDLFQYGSHEDYLAIESMSGRGKEHSYGAFDMGIGYNHQSNVPFIPSDYESPVTDQNELAALPHGYAIDYDEQYTFPTGQAEEYTHVGLSQRVCSAYSNAPPAATTAPINAVQTALHNMVPNLKKRKASVESSYDAAPAPKRINVQDPNGDCYDLKSEPSPYSSMVPTPTTMSATQLTYQLAGSPRTQGHQHSISNASHASVPAVAPYTPTVSPSFTTANTEHSPGAPTTPGARPASAASNPRLVRTSTIPNHSPQALSTSMSLVGHTQNFNPYTLYSPDSKARLHLKGNLDDVAKNWSAEELEARRKIICFQREQKGNDIYASFETVAQSDWKNHQPSVSCIWWAEKKEAYVTSVDTILLLEGIVAARFTVEEKNRIRRNLEGFKPDTVSKAKPDTEEFFKIIMGFPNPKPRNIEKDVKVFPWRILSIALQKIISKYSASYASTAASIQYQPKMYRPVDHHDFGYSTSPAPEYHGGLQMASFPVYEQARLSAPVTPVSHMHMPQHILHGQDAQTYGYGHSHGHTQIQIPQYSHVPYQGQPMTAPVTGAPQYWNHPYSSEGPMHMPPASAPPTAYPRDLVPSAPWPRDMIETADFNRGPAVPHYIHAGQR